jgi:hypothetical protein
MKMTTFDFGVALSKMSQGYAVRRTGWNGKGMYVFIVNPISFGPTVGTTMHAIEKFGDDQIVQADLLPCVAMRTADKKILLGWLASQSDMLSNDWEIAT